MEQQTVFGTMPGLFLRQANEPGSGGHRSSGSTSFTAIAATFVPTFVTALIFLSIFVLIRGSYRKLYSPRTFIGTIPEKDRTPSSSLASLSWFRDYRRLRDKFVLQHHSLDAYLFLRFFRTIIFISAIGCCITWPILFPVNATGGGYASQLDRISFSNVSGSSRVYAHAAVAWLFLGFVIFLIARERLRVIGIRQAYLLSEVNAARLAPKVVLFTGVPKDVLGSDDIKAIFGQDAEHSWPVSTLEELEDLVDDRNKLAFKLEKAEVSFLKKSQGDSAISHDGSNGYSVTGHVHRLISGSTRPTHHPKSLFGQKVDTIDSLRQNLPEAADKVEKARDSDDGRGLSAAIFVSFTTQAAARKAYRDVKFHSLLPTRSRFIGVQPKEVLWKNLALVPARRVSQASIASAFVIAVVVFWSIPIGIIGTISNIDYLQEKLKFLRFVNNLPDPILGFIKGFLPPFILSTVVSYVPNFFRYIAKLSGEPTTPQAELQTQTWYMIFQVVQVFLVTTFSSGAASVIGQIAREPGSIPDILSESLPTASNFYLSYFILQGTVSAAKTVLNYTDLFQWLFFAALFDKTPREKYDRFTSIKGISWGSVFPKFTNFAIIAIAYSCIAPLVLGFATLGLTLFYFAYRYQLLYAVNAKIDTQGEAYVRALQHLIVGVYLSELCLIGLFSARKSPGPSVLVVVLLVVTILFQLIVNRLITPLEHYLPPIAHEREQAEAQPLLAVAEEGRHNPSITDAGYALDLPDFLSPLANRITYIVAGTIASARKETASWLQESDSESREGPPSYTDEQTRTAYLNPALTSKTPIIWLPGDENTDGGERWSRAEVDGNKSAGIESTEGSGAWVDRKGKVRWNEEVEKAPVFKKETTY